MPSRWPPSQAKRERTKVRNRKGEHDCRQSRLDWNQNYRKWSWLIRKIVISIISSIYFRILSISYNELSYLQFTSAINQNISLALFEEVILARSLSLATSSIFLHCSTLMCWISYCSAASEDNQSCLSCSRPTIAPYSRALSWFSSSEYTLSSRFWLSNLMG